MLRYSSVWRLSLQNHYCHIPSESSWHKKSEKTWHFLRRVIGRDDMEHNKIHTVHPVWAGIFKQMKINWKFFFLGTCCHSLMWFETKSTAIRKCFINFAIHHLFYTLFKKLSIRELLEWLSVAMIVSSQFKNKINCQNMSDCGCWNWS